MTARFRRLRPHAALIRGDDGNVHIRRFDTAAQAATASRDREIGTPNIERRTPNTQVPSAEEVAAVIGKRSGEMRHTEFARELGISPRIVREQYKRGGLPGTKEHSAYILIVPTHLLRLARTYGLRQVERLAKAGMIA